MASLRPTLAKASSHRQHFVYDFLAPRLTQRPSHITTTRCIHTSPKRSTASAATSQDNNAYPPSSEPSRTPYSGPEAARSPAPLSKPLTKAQREFLDSAVRLLSIHPLYPLQQHTDVAIAPRQPSRRTSSNPNLQSANTPHNPFPTPPPSPNETHVRPRSRALLNLQLPNRQTPHPAHHNVSPLGSRRHNPRLDNCNARPRGRNGMHRSCGDGDRWPL